MKQKNALWQLVQEFSDVFVVDAQNLRVANLAPHEIDVQGHRPISCALRRASPEQRKEISRQVKQLLEAGIISPSYSPWSSPLVLVRKKDGTTRMCVDYRKLNAVQKKDAYPLPLVADALDLLGKQRWFTALDACSGYHQIPVHPRDRELTAFRTPDGSLYQYNSLSFGLCNAPASFQRAMDSVFADIKWDSVFVYLDDIIVFSKTFEDHLKHLREVLSRARKVDLQFKIKKCFFAKEKLQYLGHTVSADGITPDEANTDKIRRFPVPNSKKSLRSWLGLVQYYKAYLLNFSQRASKLYDLLKEGVKFEWRQEHQSIFEDLREALLKPPILTLPDFEREFFLQVDASNTALGACLSQFDEQNKEHPVVFLSRRLRKNEVKYDIREKEALAVVWAVTKLRPYLISKPFTILSDHLNLEFLKKHEQPDRLARWHLKLQSFSFVIKYRPGRANANADALSRVIYDGYLKSDEPEEDTLEFFHIAPLSLPSREELRRAQSNDPLLARLLQYLRNDSGKTPEVTEMLAGATRYDVAPDSGLLRAYVRDKDARIVVPSSMRQVILRASHEAPVSGHLGQNKTLERVRKLFFWRNMPADVRAFVRGCAVCQKRKPTEPKHHGKLMLFPASGPFMMVQLDLVGPFPTTKSGFTYVAVFVCRFTRWHELVPIKDLTANAVADALVNEIICRHGCPRMLLTDLGTNFVSRTFKLCAEKTGISALTSTAHHHATVGTAERLNWYIKNAIYSYIDGGHDNWSVILPVIAFAYRTSVIEGIGLSPFELVYGRQPVLPLDLLYGDPTKLKSNKQEYHLDLLSSFRRLYRSARDAQAKTDVRKARNYNKHHVSISFSPGDQCLLWTPPKPKSKETRQFLAKYTGPHKVLERVNRLNYKIKDGQTGRVQTVHVQRMIKFHPFLVPDGQEQKAQAPNTEEQKQADAKQHEKGTPNGTDQENRTEQNLSNQESVEQRTASQKAHVEGNGFVFTSSDGKMRILNKSVEGGKTQYVVEVDGTLDWASPSELPHNVVTEYERKFRLFRRNKRKRKQKAD